VRSVFSGSSEIVARRRLPVRVIRSARPRASPSTITCTPPLGTFAIWRIAAIVPMVFRSVGSGSSRSVVCRARNRRRSLASARFTDSIDSGREIASGCSVSGKTTVSRRASAGNSLGYVRTGSVAMLQRIV
jgi:hypothetical protein